jgi:hypothetical protein
MPEPTLHYADTSLFIGLTTMPVDGRSREFYETHIKTNFDEFKENVIRYDTLKEENNIREFSRLYNPNAYHILGEFDLAVISLIDDFSFATRTFRPVGEKTFKYQVNTGLIPVMTDVKGKANFDPVQFYENDLFPHGKKLPLIGITSIKLNNTLMVGNGKTFTRSVCFYLKYYLKEYLERMIAKYAGQELHYKFLIIESLGWNEITLVSFSNAFEAIQEAVGELRNTNWKDICDFLRARDIAPGDIEKNSLLQFWIDFNKDSDATTTPSVDAAHPFIATNTQLGFHIDYTSVPGHNGFLPVMDARWKLSDPTTIAAGFQVSWNVKGGHDALFLENMQKVLGFEPSCKIYQVAGKNSFIYPADPVCFAEYFEKIHEPLANDPVKVKAISEQLYKMETAVIVEASSENYALRMNGMKKNQLQACHMEIAGLLDSLKFDYEKFILPLDQILRTLNLSKILNSQVIYMYQNFNEAIKDQLIFNNFIDLKGALQMFFDICSSHFGKTGLVGPKDNIKGEGVIDNIKASTTDLIDEIKGTKPAASGAVRHVNRDQIKTIEFTKDVKEFVEAWDIAFWNRYFHSYYFTEVSDFNLEHHGGIEMILSAYDSMYKIINKAIYGKKYYEQFVRVTIEPNISSTSYSNKLNFIHLFLPSLYATTAVHEAANHYIFELTQEFPSDPELHDFLNRLPGADLNEHNKYYELFCELKSSYDYNSLTEKKLLDEYVGANLYRYLVTDYLTYRLQYEDKKNIKQGVDKYLGFHLASIAQQTELYRYDANMKNLEFDEMHFKAFMLRTILMFRIFDIHFEPRSFAPFSVFQPFFNNSITEIENNAEKLKGKMEVVTTMIKKHVVKKADSILEKPDKYFTKVINLNKWFLNEFYKSFRIDTSKNAYKANVVIRATAPITGRKANIVTDLDGSKIDYADVLVDPKGGLFLLSIKKRRDLHKLNCKYLKFLWNIAQNWRIELYKKS